MRSSLSQLPRLSQRATALLLSKFARLANSARRSLSQVGRGDNAAPAPRAAGSALSMLLFPGAALFAEGMLQSFAPRPLLVALVLLLVLAPLAFYIGYRLGRGQGDPH